MVHLPYFAISLILYLAKKRINFSCELATVMKSRQHIDFSFLFVKNLKLFQFPETFDTLDLKVMNQYEYKQNLVSIDVRCKTAIGTLEENKENCVLIKPEVKLWSRLKPIF